MKRLTAPLLVALLLLPQITVAEPTVSALLKGSSTNVSSALDAVDDEAVLARVESEGARLVEAKKVLLGKWWENELRRTELMGATRPQSPRC